MLGQREFILCLREANFGVRFIQLSGAITLIGYPATEASSGAACALLLAI
jgi:hypothetical protein